LSFKSIIDASCFASASFTTDAISNTIYNPKGKSCCP
jgi:hypothetical protein